MGVLDRAAAAIALAIGVASCYSPDLAECAVTCATTDDCAPGQTCGSDRLCASPELAGHCDDQQPDAGMPPHHPDARAQPDAHTTPDATAATILRLDVIGRGKIKAGPPVMHDCNAGNENGESCMFPAPLGAVVTLTAEDGHGWTFDHWTGCTSTTMPKTCVVTVGPGTTNVSGIFVEN